MIPLSWYLIVAAILFCIGLYGAMARRNAISILMGYNPLFGLPQRQPTSGLEWHPVPYLERPVKKQKEALPV